MPRPSGNSTCCLNLQRLGYLLDRPRYLELARRQLENMGLWVGRGSRWLSATGFGPWTSISAR